MSRDMIRPMSAEKEEKLHPETCWWCSDKNDPYHLNVGPGIFRDFDSDLSYGIPICGGCGGLGLQYKTEDFQRRIQEIMDLRFKYCPNDPKERERLSASQKLGIIVELEKQIRSLVDEYGFGVEESFAQQIVNGRLASIKEVLKVAKRAEKARLN